MRSADKVRRAPVRVIPIGGNPLANRYLRALLERHGGFQIMDPEQLRTGLLSCPKFPGVFLIDSESLRVPLLQCLRTLQSDFPGSEFLVIGHARLGEDLPGLLSIGMHGFVEYKVVEEELLQAIRAVAAGHLWIPKELLEQYVCTSHNRPHSYGFTRREESITGLPAFPFPPSEKTSLPPRTGSPAIHKVRTLRLGGRGVRRTWPLTECHMVARGMQPFPSAPASPSNSNATLFHCSELAVPALVGSGFQRRNWDRQSLVPSPSSPNST